MAIESNRKTNPLDSPGSLRRPAFTTQPTKVNFRFHEPGALADFLHLERTRRAPQAHFCRLCLLWVTYFMVSVWHQSCTVTRSSAVAGVKLVFGVFLTSQTETMNRIPNNSFGSASPVPLPKSDRVSLAGCLLAAHLDMSDPMFRQGVCLIVEQTDEATVGIMLNRPLSIDPSPLWKSLFEGGPAMESGVVGDFHFGGPQKGPIVAIHNDSKHADGGNSQGVYVSAQAESLQKLATTAPQYLRWYIGHAVWSKSQLEQEIVDGKWYVVPAIPKIVFAEESQMWLEAVRFSANSVIGTVPGIDHLPSNPRVN